MKYVRVGIFTAILYLATTFSGVLSQNYIILQSTTSTQNSGLFEYLLPHFYADTGIEVRVVAVGTGQALRNASRCDGDVVIVHSIEDEIEFVAKGYGVERYDLMHNEFVFIGPGRDPADISNSDSPTEALIRIAQTQSIFVSRGDNSGTHMKEIRLWQDAGLAPDGFWYRETGSGMGSTLNIAIGMNGYTLSDRATWTSFQNKAHHTILLENYSNLVNQYGIIAVNTEHCPGTRIDSTNKFIEWLISPKGQELIANYNVNDTVLFFPFGTSRSH